MRHYIKIEEGPNQNHVFGIHGPRMPRRWTGLFCLNKTLDIWWTTIGFEHIVVAQSPWLQVYNIIRVPEIWFVQMQRDTLCNVHCVLGTFTEPTFLILCFPYLFWFQCRADLLLFGTVVFCDYIPTCQVPQRYVRLVVVCLFWPCFWEWNYPNALLFLSIK